MDKTIERRRENRIRFSWPLWFGYEENGEFFRGQVFDLSRNGVSFIIDDTQCPSVGQHIVTRFSYPKNTTENFHMESYYHWSEVLRVHQETPKRCRVAMRLHRPLAKDPALPVAEPMIAAS